MSELSRATQDVIAERLRQIAHEGWTPKHDDDHKAGEMALAAACYAIEATKLPDLGDCIARLWPWDIEWWKPRDRRHDLVRAGALILAEIERLDRRGHRPRPRPAPAPAPDPERVEKISGYKWPGAIVARFFTLAGKERVVVECTTPEVAGALHIFAPDQLRAVGEAAS